MPVLRLDGGDISLPRNVALLDTNILVARFNDRDDLHGNAVETLEADVRFEWLVTGPVLVEACGLLRSRRTEKEVQDLLLWLKTPGGRVSVLTCAEGPNEHQSRLPEHFEFISARKIDFVDCYLMHVATLIASAMGAEAVPIVTVDSRDFFSGAGGNYRYGVLNWRQFESDVIVMA